MTFKIQNNIPLPWEVKWPLEEMKKRDSFLIKGTGEKVERKRSAVLVFAKSRKIKVTTKKSATGVRVWRVS